MNSAQRQAMKMYQTTTYDAAVDYSDQYQLVHLLFTALVDSLADTERHLTDGNLAKKSETVTKAQKILYGLRNTLDFEGGGEVARNLDSLYDYCLRRLAQAATHNEVEPVQEVRGLMLEIREAWSMIPAKYCHTAH